MDLTRACALARRANEWPRCGERWPIDGQERRAAAVLTQAGLTFEQALWHQPAATSSKPADGLNARAINDKLLKGLFG